MSTHLTNEEKADIINQHIRNIERTKFGIEIFLVEENARTVKDTETIATLNAQLVDSASRIVALTAELDKLV